MALLVWGLRMVRTGLTRAYGAELRRLLSLATANRVIAFGAGVLVTAILQSSTATALMTASFAGRRLIETAGALAIMLGADVGTTLVAQVLSFNVHWLSPLLLVVGVVAFMRSERTHLRDLGRVAVGLGLMLLALQLIVGNSEPLRASQVLAELLGALAGEPVLAVAVAALITALVHSSLAVVLLVLSMTASGLVSLDLGFVLVLGANLGGTLPPFLATMALGPHARRVGLGNMAFKVLAGAALLPLVADVSPYLALIEADPARQIANFHTGFNLALAAVFLFLLGPAARLVQRLIPDAAAAAEDESKPKYLDESAMESPAVALASAARETLRMGDTVERMLRGTLEVLDGNDRRLVGEIAKLDDVVDRLHEAIKLYLTALTRGPLSDEESTRSADILAFTTNLEHVGDIIDKSLIDIAAKKVRNKLTFSEEGFAEIRGIYQRVLTNLGLALGVFITGDLSSARKLLAEKTHLREMENAATESHLERLRRGMPETLETTSLHMDILRDLRRINAHLTSVAYPILEAAGELRPSRLKESEG